MQGLSQAIVTILNINTLYLNTVKILNLVFSQTSTLQMPGNNFIRLQIFKCAANQYGTKITFKTITYTLQHHNANLLKENLACI